MINKLFMLSIVACTLTVTSSVHAVEGLPYQAEPFENLIVSGQPTLEQLNTISEEGFSTVINLRRAGEFDDFDEAGVVEKLGMTYVHIPIEDVEAIRVQDAEKLHQAITSASGPILLHCTVGWRAGSLLAIERFLIHSASREEAVQIASDAHMSHASGDVEEWLAEYGKRR